MPDHTPPTQPAIPDMFCMCCGEAADLQRSNEGYSHCCNDRITSDPEEHPSNADELEDEVF